MASHIITEQLGNGLTVAVEPMPHLRSVSWTLLIPAGSAGDPDGQNGSAQLLAGMLYRGAGDRDARQLSDALDDLGVQRSGRLDYEYATFGGACLADDLAPALTLYADIVRRPQLPATELDAERALALQALASLNDNPTQKLFTQLTQVYFPGSFGRSRIGTAEDLERIDIDDLKRDHSTRFGPNGAILSVAGGVQFEEVRVIHVGGTYGDRATGRDRWVETYERLSEPVRRRLVLENDDTRYSSADVISIHERTGVPLIFDYQHHWCNNPEGLDWTTAIRRCVGSWPSGVQPKIHYSSPRTEMRTLKRKVPGTRRTEEVQQPPVWTGHADYLNPFEFITFMRTVPDLNFDVMLEAKVKDLALFRIRRDLARYAPDVAQRFGLQPSTGVSPDEDDLILQGEELDQTVIEEQA